VSTASFDRQPSAALIKPPDPLTNGFEIVPAVLEGRELADVAASLKEEGLEYADSLDMGAGLELAIA
jgi:hypothetical protein